MCFEHVCVFCFFGTFLCTIAFKSVWNGQYPDIIDKRRKNQENIEGNFTFEFNKTDDPWATPNKVSVLNEKKKQFDIFEQIDFLTFFFYLLT